MRVVAVVIITATARRRHWLFLSLQIVLLSIYLSFVCVRQFHFEREWITCISHSKQRPWHSNSVYFLFECESNRFSFSKDKNENKRYGIKQWQWRHWVRCVRSLCTTHLSEKTLLRKKKNSNIDWTMTARHKQSKWDRKDVSLNFGFLGSIFLGPLRQ